MANITVSVQSFLNSAARLSITIDDAQTVAALKTAINTAEGTPTAIMDLYFGTTQLVNTDVLSAKSIVNGSYIQTSNNLTEALLWTKQQRQAYKLQLAELRRQAGGDTAQPYYREYNVADVNLLPNPYNNNDVDPDDGAVTLSEHRPWTA